MKPTVSLSASRRVLRRPLFASLLALLAVVFVFSRSAGAEGPPLAGGLRQHRGRPMVLLNGKASGLPTYSALRRPDMFPKTTPTFFQHPIAVYMVEIPMDSSAGDFFGTPWWVGDKISEKPLAP